MIFPGKKVVRQIAPEVKNVRGKFSEANCPSGITRGKLREANCPKPARKELNFIFVKKKRATVII